MPPTCATSPTACTGRSTRRSRRHAARARWQAARAGSRCRTSRPARRPSGARGRALVERIERARAAGLDVEADQYPYTAASTTLATLLPPAILALDPEDAAAAIREPATRARIREAQATGLSGWENVAADPGWDGIVIARSAARPEWSGRSLATIADALGGDPFELALDVLAEDRLNTDIVLHCMAEPDLEAIMRGALDRGLHRCRRPPARTTRSSTTASRTRAATARPRASSGATCATGA